MNRLAYWQRFIGGIGFHETTTYLHDGWRGSHGCVNLLAAARIFMFGARDVWFVVGLPVFLDVGGVIRSIGKDPIHV